MKKKNSSDEVTRADMVKLGCFMAIVPIFCMVSIVSLTNAQSMAGYIANLRANILFYTLGMGLFVAFLIIIWIVAKISNKL